eukprot:3806757-Prorocentrum_lima.AAC.1
MKEKERKAEEKRCRGVRRFVLNPSPALMALAELHRNPPEGVSVGLVDDSNIFVWEVMIVGAPNTFYEEGMFRATLEFPPDFPNSPPVMRFISEMWHPNVYEDGR